METENDRPKVLYVDDERNNLVSFKASFRMEFDVKLASSMEEAMEVLKSFEPHVIISDYRMPFVTGVELFEKIRYFYPLPLRVLLTAYGDAKSLTEAINRGQVYRYIKKPWVEDEIRNVVRDAYGFFYTRNELEQRNQELSAAYSDLDRFVYSVSHDIRSPLMGILSVTSLIQKSENLAEVKELSELITRNVNRLDEFVHNLLDYYKVKRGSLTIEPMDFKSYLLRITDLFASEIMASKINLSIDVEQHEEFRGDPLVLQVALQNLISNAVKYQQPDNPDKKIRISVKVNHIEAQIQIEDNGIGIDPAYQDRIYEMFFRASSIGTGSGIGLYNAKHSLDKLNATLQLNSIPGQGTTFNIRIPSK